jgi:hypothetical protein
MQKIEKYKANDGREFNTEVECKVHENLIAEADKIFKDWPVPIDSSCGFSNGEGYIQLTKELYDSVRNGLLDLIRDTFPKWKSMQEAVDITRNMDSNWGIIGRYLDDSDTPLYKYWCQLLNVEADAECAVKNYRLWGQGYFARNPKEGKQVEWKKIKKWGAK